MQPRGRLRFRRTAPARSWVGHTEGVIVLLLMVLLFLVVLFVAFIWAGEVPDETQPDLLFRTAAPDGIEWSLVRKNASCDDPAAFFCGGFRVGMPSFFDSVRVAPPHAKAVCAWGAEHARTAAAFASLSGVYADPKADVALVRRYFGEAPTDMSMRAVPHRFPEAAKRSTLARWAERLSGTQCEDALVGVGWGSAVEASVAGEVARVLGREVRIWPSLNETYSPGGEGSTASGDSSTTLRNPLTDLARDYGDAVPLPAALANHACAASLDLLFGRVAALRPGDAQTLHDALADEGVFFYAMGQALCGGDVAAVSRVRGYDAWCANHKE